MSNGAECCALEICCNFAQRRARLAAQIATETGTEEEYCLKVLDWVDSRGLTFAPRSFAKVAADVAEITRHHDAAGGH